VLFMPSSLKSRLLRLLWAKYDLFWPCRHLLKPGKHLEAFLELSVGSSEISGLLCMLWAKHDSFWPFWQVFVPDWLISSN
jgi:hypothetical protein